MFVDSFLGNCMNALVIQESNNTGIARSVKPWLQKKTCDHKFVTSAMK